MKAQNNARSGSHPTERNSLSASLKHNPATSFPNWREACHARPRLRLVQEVTRMTNPLENLLARLAGVRAIGPDRWMAPCPAHQDRSPSLSVRYTDGRLLLHCFAGCANDDVLAAIGLEFRDLYDPDPGQPRRDHTGPRRPSAADLERREHARLLLHIAAADLQAGRQFGAADREAIEGAIATLTGGPAHVC
jgi:putative DNA primase/helicase